MGIIRYVTQIAQIYECFLIFLCKDSIIIIWYSKNNYTEKSENIFFCHPINIKNKRKEDDYEKEDMGYRNSSYACG